MDETEESRDSNKVTIDFGPIKGVFTIQNMTIAVLLCATGLTARNTLFGSSGADSLSKSLEKNTSSLSNLQNTVSLMSSAQGVSHSDLKQIGDDLINMHTTITRIDENVKDIEEEMRRVKHMKF